MEKEIILKSFDEEELGTLLSRVGDSLTRWEDCRAAMVALIKDYASALNSNCSMVLNKDMFVFLVREASFDWQNGIGERGQDNSTYHNGRFAEALYEYLLGKAKHNVVITDLFCFLDNIGQDMCCGEYLADGLKRAEVKGIPFGEDNTMKEVRKIYKDVFQASNGYWIFVHRMESIKIN